MRPLPHADTNLMYGDKSNGFRMISWSLAGGDNISSVGSLSKVKLGETDDGTEMATIQILFLLQQCFLIK